MNPTASESKHNTLKGGLWGVIQLMAVMLTTIIQSRLAVTKLEPEASGVWFLLLGVSAMLALFDFGIGSTLTRELGFATQNPKHQANLISTAKRLIRIVGLIIWLLGIPLGAWYFQSISSANFFATALEAWLVFVIGAGFLLNANAQTAALIGLGLMARERQVRSVMQILGLILAWGFMEVQASLISLCAAWVVQQFFLWLLLWLLLRSKQQKGNYSAQIAQHLWKIGIQWWLMAVGGYLILNTDNFVIANTLGVEKIADYALLARLSTLVLPFSLVFVVSAVPQIAQATAENNLVAIQNIFFLHVRLGLLILIPCLTIILSVPEALLTLWVGTGHFLGYPILIVFAIMLTLEVHHVLCASVLMATGKLPFAPWALGAGILNLGLSFALAIPLGLFGVALGTMLAQMLTNNWFAPWITLCSLQIPMLEYLRRVLLPFLLGLGLALLGGQVLGFLVQSTPLIQSMVLMFWAILAFVLAANGMFSSVEKSPLIHKFWRILGRNNG